MFERDLWLNGFSRVLSAFKFLKGRKSHGVSFLTTTVSIKIATVINQPLINCIHLVLNKNADSKILFRRFDLPIKYYSKEL